jgi:antitoxin VapB
MSETVRLYKTGGHQALKLPRGFELPGKEATVRKVGDTLVLEAKATKPKSGKNLLQVLEALEPVDEEFPDVDEGLLPLEDIDL